MKPPVDFFGEKGADVMSCHWQPASAVTLSPSVEYDPLK